LLVLKAVAIKLGIFLIMKHAFCLDYSVSLWASGSVVIAICFILVFLPALNDFNQVPKFESRAGKFRFYDVKIFLLQSSLDAFQR
jgi:hypothetical protein